MAGLIRFIIVGAISYVIAIGILPGFLLFGYLYWTYYYTHGIGTYSHQQAAIKHQREWQETSLAEKYEIARHQASQKCPSHFAYYVSRYQLKCGE